MPDTPVSTVHGYPRQGPNRELKRATEAYWAGRLDADGLLGAAADLRLARLHELRDAGLGEIPGNDFSLYDHVLDTAIMLGAVPARHRDAVPDASSDAGRLARYFAMARGTADASPLEMTKWFDTNYHYLVPELGPDTSFVLDAAKPLREFAQARDAGIVTRPVVLGPLSFLLLAKPTVAGFAPLDLLDDVLGCYVQLLADLDDAGVQWVQLDEPVLVCDQPRAVLDAARRAYDRLAGQAARPKILVASYFDRLGDALPALAATAVDGLALDVTGPARGNVDDLEAVGGLPGRRLVAGVVDGRNVWRTDLSSALDVLERLRPLAARVDVATSCSLLHVPLDVAAERSLDPEVAGWLAFARQKLDECNVLTRGLADGRAAVAAQLRQNGNLLAARAASPITRVATVRERAAAVRADDLRRSQDYASRSEAQRKRLDLPLLPTTTIGSFPQTAELRRARADLRAGRTDAAGYEATMRAEVASVIAEQERLGLDVLVHGEPERNDMVQYFAEQLDGFLATEHGWVQSYGSRYVRPPIVAGDVSRPRPMTLDWTSYAQTLTERPVKGMLTGPVTMLAWSFVRDDQPAADTARQVALALRDEVHDLEAAGTAIIQVDEPALRETLPLRAAGRAEYLRWAVESFQLATSVVAAETQIHTHMCYAEFGEILDAIVAMDADVISLEAARSRMSIVADLARAGYPNEAGPGVWDIHSPAVPSAPEIATRLRAALERFPAQRLWVNPDCGLKTRGYDEVRASLANMVAAAREVRAQH